MRRLCLLGVRRRGLDRQHGHHLARLQTTVAIDGTPAVQGDRASLRRALANLIRNAAEAGAATVTIAAEPDADLAILTIADDGPGLPDVVRANLFQPFVTSGKPGGTGLGLAITRDLVRAQGGDVGLLSTAETGTTFRLALRTPLPDANMRRLIPVERDGQ